MAMTGTKIVTKDWVGIPHCISVANYDDGYIYMATQEGDTIYFSRALYTVTGYELLNTLTFTGLDSYDFKIYSNKAYILTADSTNLKLTSLDLDGTNVVTVTLTTGTYLDVCSMYISQSQIYYVYVADSADVLYTAISDLDGSGFAAIEQTGTSKVNFPVVCKEYGGDLYYLWFQIITTPEESKGTYLYSAVKGVYDNLITVTDRGLVGTAYNSCPISAYMASDVLYFTYLYPQSINSIYADLYVGSFDIGTSTFTLNKEVADVGTVLVRSYVSSMDSGIVYAWTGGRTDLSKTGSIYKGAYDDTIFEYTALTSVTPCKRLLAFTSMTVHEYYIWTEQTAEGFFDLYMGMPVYVTGVTLDKDAVYPAIGGTETLTATIAPANADNTDVTWTSSNDSVATVDDGVVTGVAAGTCTITVTTADGGYTDTATAVVLADDDFVGNKVYKFNSGTETITSEIETEIFTEYIANKKYYNGVMVRAELESGASMAVYIKVDGGAYALKDTFTATGLQTFNVEINPDQCDNFQVKLVMTGEYKIHHFARRLYVGGF